MFSLTNESLGNDYSVGLAFFKMEAGETRPEQLQTYTMLVSKKKGDVRIASTTGWFLREAAGATDAIETAVKVAAAQCNVADPAWATLLDTAMRRSYATCDPAFRVCVYNRGYGGAGVPEVWFSLILNQATDEGRALLAPLVDKPVGCSSEATPQIPKTSRLQWNTCEELLATKRSVDGNGHEMSVFEKRVHRPCFIEIAAVDRKNKVLLHTKESGWHIAETYRCRLLAGVCAEHNAQVAAAADQANAGSVGDSATTVAAAVANAASSNGQSAQPASVGVGRSRGGSTLASSLLQPSFLL